MSQKFSVQVLVPVRDASRARDYSIERGSAFPCNVHFVECASDPGSIFENWKAADVLYVRGLQINAKVIENLRNCRLIIAATVGVDNIDVSAATRSGIPVINMPDLFSDEVAEHAATLILSAYKRIKSLDNHLRSGSWTLGHQVSAKITSFSETTLGFVGFGRVAQSVAVKLAAFGVKMIAYDPYVSEKIFEKCSVENVDLTTLAQRSDTVSLHLPASFETNRMIGETFFSQVKKGAIIVNTGRGVTIDEVSLVDAIQKGVIAGAALDVFDTEPIDQDNPLLKLDNVLLTPHIASITSGFEPKRKQRVGVEILTFFSKEISKNCVNPEVFQI